MKHKDIIILKKIIQYCNDVEEACVMFQNDFEAFKNQSVFRNATVCAFYKLENCVK